MDKDPRNAELARIFVEHSLKVKKNDKVVLMTSDLLPLDLIRETYRIALQKGAIVYLDIMGWNFLLDRSSYGGLSKVFYEEASDKQLEKIPRPYEDIVKWGEKFVRITTIADHSHLSETPPEKVMKKHKAFSDSFSKMIDKDWILTYYPTEDMAKQSGMSFNELVDFYFNATLIDYKEMEKKGKKLKKLLDDASKVRIIGDKTDLRIDIEGRVGANSAGKRNIPDGEVFYAPVHLNTEGYIYYDLPFAKAGHEMNGVYLEFVHGKVVKATAETGEEDLYAGLEVDEGAKYLGELGIGMNSDIDRVMKSTIFDEKIGGTVHVTLGSAYSEKEGGNPDKDRNDSAIHWDLVKDMRKPGSTIEVDGEVKFRDGEWFL